MNVCCHLMATCCCVSPDLMVVVDESFPTHIQCCPSLICWAQYGCSQATWDTCPAYTIGIIQFSMLSSLQVQTKTCQVSYIHCYNHWCEQISAGVSLNSMSFLLKILFFIDREVFMQTINLYRHCFNHCTNFKTESNSGPYCFCRVFCQWCNRF